MMQTGAITQYVDVAQVTLYVFWAFFFVLVFWMHREGKREGYPLVSEIQGHTEEPVTEGFPRMPPPKVVPTWFGHDFSTPETSPPRFPVNAVPAGNFPGAPLEPTGNPMVDGIGPASWAFRRDIHDLNKEREIRYVPMREFPEFSLDPSLVDPIGMRVVGADRLVAGTVVDVWIDRVENEVVWLEVALGGDPADVVMVPQPFVRFRKRLREVSVRAILAEQFALIPRLKEPNRITRLEEDKIVGYFGGGALYATPARIGPLL